MTCIKPEKRDEFVNVDSDNRGLWKYSHHFIFKWVGKKH